MSNRPIISSSRENQAQVNAMNNNSSNNNSFTGLDKYLYHLHDFYSEFFSILLPGFITLTLILLEFLVAFIYLEKLNILKSLKAISEKIINGWFYGIAMFSYLILAYAIGAILHRRPPKEPDFYSSLMQWKYTNNYEEKKHSAVQLWGIDISNYFSKSIIIRILEKCFGTSIFLNSCLKRVEKFNWILLLPWLKTDIIKRRNNIPDIDYPYPCMRQYLLLRNMTKLARLIPWCMSSGLDYNNRSKHLINKFKSIIIFYGNNQTIVNVEKNESDIRLLSSIWYALCLVARINIYIMIFVVFLKLNIFFDIVNYYLLMPFLLILMYWETKILFECITWSPQGDNFNNNPELRNKEIFFAFTCVSIVMFLLFWGGEDLNLFHFEKYQDWTKLNNNTLYALFSAVIYVFISLIIYHIEVFIHYVRNREIVFILEAMDLLISNRMIDQSTINDIKNLNNTLFTRNKEGTKRYEFNQYTNDLYSRLFIYDDLKNCIINYRNGNDLGEISQKLQEVLNRLFQNISSNQNQQADSEQTPPQDSNDGEQQNSRSEDTSQNEMQAAALERARTIQELDEFIINFQNQIISNTNNTSNNNNRLANEKEILISFIENIVVKLNENNEMFNVLGIDNRLKKQIKQINHTKEFRCYSCPKIYRDECFKQWN